MHSCCLQCLNHDIFLEFWDMECQSGTGIHPFHPFAFRVHSHNLGRAIWGYKIDGKTQEWSLIGKNDPM